MQNGKIVVATEHL